MYYHQLSLRIAAIFIIYSLIFNPSILSQESRPRRVSEQESTVVQSPAISPATHSTLVQLSGEYVMRIGLATNAYSVRISTNRTLLNVSDKSAPLPLGSGSVRIESRLLAPLPPTKQEIDGFYVELTQLETRQLADRAAQEIEALTGDRPNITESQANRRWQVRTRSAMSRDEAEALRGQLEDAGLDQVAVVETPKLTTPTTQTQVATSSPTPNNRPSRPTGLGVGSGVLRPVYRSSVPTREVLVYSSGSVPLLNARAPVTFASDDEQNSPLLFNGKSYRGHLEVFANSRGSLTVVNVVDLEEYVRGVVPNELSPGGFPALEALKAQAVAARTYAISNRGRFASDGFDLLPTTRSQVYGGLSTEHPLTDRAVGETRGIIATYNGEPINALYTSTCGGRTENVENIFSEHVPYLRGRDCLAVPVGSIQPFIVRTSREVTRIQNSEHVSAVRDASLLSVYNFSVPARLTDEWFSSPLGIEELKSWISSTALLARMPVPTVNSDATRTGEFCSTVARALDGESRGDVLLNPADIEYLLSFTDGSQILSRNRADVAMFIREGYITLYPDATLRPQQPITRARALYTIANALESRGLLTLQKATARPSTNGALTLRSNKGADRTLTLRSDAYLFKAFGNNLHQVREVALVGGESVLYHADSRGQVDYIEVSPAENGAASDRFSSFSNWSKTESLWGVSSRLSRAARNIGTVVNIRVAARGTSRRVTDLEIIGTQGTSHVYGGRIRSILGLREQLFVIDRTYDESGRVVSLTFTGRGWGHGVGMCQVGAYGLAKAGLTYEQILKAYYTDINLTKLY
jgi:stage II sporulation protein D